MSQGLLRGRMEKIDTEGAKTKGFHSNPQSVKSVSWVVGSQLSSAHSGRESRRDGEGYAL